MSGQGELVYLNPLSSETDLETPFFVCILFAFKKYQSKEKIMNSGHSILLGILVGSIGLMLVFLPVMAQTDVVRETDTQSDQPNSNTQIQQVIDPEVDAAFAQRIQELREDAQRQIADLQTAMESNRGTDQDASLRAIGEIKRNAEISILEVRSEQELARGNPEMAAKFQQAAEMMRNPAPRQAPDPVSDQSRFEQQRTTEESRTR
jgi:hypothetical protein